MSYIYIIQDNQTLEVLGGGDKKYHAEWAIKQLGIPRDRYDLIAFKSGDPDSKRIITDHRDR